jgi:hypothetical protein
MLPAFFGTPITSQLSGTIVNSPNNGCGAISPYTAGQFTGQIVLIQRGACNFFEKALNANYYVFSISCNGNISCICYSLQN